MLNREHGAFEPGASGSIDRGAKLKELLSTVECLSSDRGWGEDELSLLLEEVRRHKDRGELYRRCLAGLAGLALHLAGEHADHCRYCQVGDLLCNPRRVVLYIKGESMPRLKQRHTPISTQLADVIPNEAVVAEWLRDNCLARVEQPPILPVLKDMLIEAGMSDVALGFEQGLRHLSDAVRHFAGAGFQPGVPAREQLHTCLVRDRVFLQKFLCGFRPDELRLAN